MARCNANTKAGKRCQNEATRSGRCSVHQRGGRSASSQSSRRSRAKRTPTGRPTGAKSTAGRLAADCAELARELMAFADSRKGTVVASVMVSRRAQRAMAYGYHHLDQRVIKQIAFKGAREVAEKALIVGARVAFKAVPVIGWATLAYDTYQLGTYMHEECEDDESWLGRGRQ